MIDPVRLSLGRRLIETHIPYFRENFGQVDSQWKADRSRVTEVDLRISHEILSTLALELPEDLALSEEDEMPDQERFARHAYVWVLDPVDGTNNYACGLSSCAISLGLLHRGEPVYGWIYDFGLDSVFHGGPGHGLFQNEKQIQMRLTKSSSEQRLVAIHFPLAQEAQARMVSVLSQFKIRALGSAALNLLYVALGQMDAVMEHGIKVWDIAAAAAMAHECGIQLYGGGKDLFPLQDVHLVSEAFGYAAGDADIVSLMLGEDIAE